LFNIFQQPWTLLVAAVLVWFIIVLIRSGNPDKKRWWHFLIPVAVIAAGFALDYFVQTDRERITAVVKNVSEAVENEDCSGVEPYISQDYRDSIHYTKADLMAHCANRLSEPLIKENIARTGKIEIKDNQATCRFSVRIVFEKQSSVARNFFVEFLLLQFKAEMEKKNNRWQITSGEVLRINNRPAGWSDIR
jgi:hypothetical protein